MVAAMTVPLLTSLATAIGRLMSDRFENDETHAAHPEWIVEHRPCVFCSVLRCGCPDEPLPILRLESHIVLGEN